MALAQAVLRSASPSPFSQTTRQDWEKAAGKLASALISEAVGDTEVALSFLGQARADLVVLDHQEAEEGHSSQAWTVIESITQMMITLGYVAV